MRIKEGGEAWWTRMVRGSDRTREMGFSKFGLIELKGVNPKTNRNKLGSGIAGYRT